MWTINIMALGGGDPLQLHYKDSAEAWAAALRWLRKLKDGPGGEVSVLATDESGVDKWMIQAFPLE